MKREQARAIGLFFLLGLMDERVALSAASRTVARLKAEFPEISRRGKDHDPLPVVDIIKICRDSWKAHRKLIPRNQPIEVPTTSWTVPAGVDIALWARYQKDAPDDDIMTLLFSLVLDVDDESLAEGFQTSVGTVRYRLGKAVRQLGLVVRGRTEVVKGGPSV